MKISITTVIMMLFCVFMAFIAGYTRTAHESLAEIEPRRDCVEFSAQVLRECSAFSSGRDVHYCTMQAQEMYEICDDD